MHHGGFGTASKYRYIYIPPARKPSEPALRFYVLCFKKNQWRCGFVHIFIMHIIVFWRIYSGELKIYCFFQWILCFCSLKTPVFLTVFLWKIVFRVGFGRPKCHSFVLLLAVSYSLRFKVSNEACWLECQWRHCHIRMYMLLTPPPTPRVSLSTYDEMRKLEIAWWWHDDCVMIWWWW